MKRNLLYLIGVVCMMTSCIEEQNVIEIVPTPGKDVQFSATLGADAKTRTLYGEDNTSAIKVNWVQDDKIAVFGEDCTNKQAEYSVNVGVEATPNGDGQNYADGLVKTGAAGVQWGEDGVSDFYAVYPSTNAKFNTVDGKVNSISTSISSTQNYVFNSTTDDDGVWRGTNFGTDARTPSMQNAVMFAYTKDATSVYYNEDGTVYTDAEGNTKAKPVDLHFKPFSTVLKFRFEGFSYDFGDAVTNSTVYVQSITVTAPQGTKLAGDFDITSFDGSGSTATAVASTEGKTTSNVITINTILPAGGYLPLQADEAVEFDVFAIPQKYSITGGDNPWKVTINASVAGANQSYTYSLIPTGNQSYGIAAGQIHKLKVPAYTISTPPTWDPSKWMTQIPTPVYLSELSVPGAWYCMDEDYQNITDVATLYGAGIRAFNIDCRVTKRGDTNDGSMGIENPWNDANDYPAHAYLACAGTETETGIIKWFGLNDGDYVSDVVKNICNLAQTHKDEYVVIVFTFAEKPKTISGDKYGSVRADYITEMLHEVLNTDGIKEYLYTGVTKDTTIDDVLKSGKNVIVKINHSNVNFVTNADPSFSMPEGHMASFGSMAMSGYIENGVTDIVSELTTATSPYYGYYSKMQAYPIYNGKAESGLTYYYHQAQNTSDDQTRGTTTYSSVPTLGQRMDAIDNIITKSTEIYDASSHNAWFQMGIGGSIDGDNPSGVSEVLNDYLSGKIEEKMESDPSPVGIVLMNHATTTNSDGEIVGIQLVNDIIEMNGKFYLKRKGGDITTGTDNNSGSGGDEMEEV